MAEFDPPQNHWAADFDRRLISSFYHLKDENEALKARVAALEARDKDRDAALAQAVADMKHYAQGK